MKSWWKSGTPWLWLNAAALAISVVMVVGVLGLIALRGLGHFWPHDVQQITLKTEEGGVEVIAGIIQGTESVPVARLNDTWFLKDAMTSHAERQLIKLGNRDITGKDFKWIWQSAITSASYPENLYVLERFEWGIFIGYLEGLQSKYQVKTSSADLDQALYEAVKRSEFLRERIAEIEKGDIGSINHQMESIRLERKRLELNNALDSHAQSELEKKKMTLDSAYNKAFERLSGLKAQLEEETVVMRTVDNREVVLPLSSIVQAFKPNSMNVFEKIAAYAHNFISFISDDPREANTEGGVFPAIFGTVTMVIIMSIFVTPLGVVAAVYLREYANQGKLTAAIRIAVNNLAGVPSIVYGVFGLGFFVYFLGGSIDTLFYPETFPAPVFGTPGLLWASVTLALLTVPVVIVATEEGLARIPKSVREGSLALGATKFETLYKVVIPMASPAMMTGLILAVARAAGEVAPLMLVGVVKLAPTLPIDGHYPFIHLERKFMHLGFHIYDVGFQSPNIDAARPLVYATSFLLVGVTATLNLSAIYIRNRLRDRYKSLES